MAIFKEHFQWLQAVVRFVVFVESVVFLIILIWLKQFILIMKYCKQRVSRLRTQTYFRLSLVSDENNVCEPEPRNDLCDVTTFVSLWPIRFHDGMKLECSLQRLPRAVVLGLLELNCLIGLKFQLHRNRFWLEFAKVIFGREKRQPEIRLLSRANKSRLKGFFVNLPTACYIMQSLEEQQRRKGKSEVRFLAKLIALLHLTQCKELNRGHPTFFCQSWWKKRIGVRSFRTNNKWGLNREKFFISSTKGATNFQH